MAAAGRSLGRVCAAAAVTDAIARPHARLGARLQGGDASCADFSVTAQYAEWLSLISIAYRVPGKLTGQQGVRFTNNAERISTSGQRCAKVGRLSCNAGHGARLAAQEAALLESPAIANVHG